MVEKNAMTERQRIEALLNHERPDRVPIWHFANQGFCVVHSNTCVADAYNKPQVSLAAQRKVCREFGWVFVPTIGYAAFGAWEFGGTIKWPEKEFDQAPTPASVPVESVEDAMKIEMPDVGSTGMVPIMKEFYTLASKERLDNEPFNVLPWAGAVFTVAANICDPERLARWLIKKPDVAHRILQLTTDYVVELARHFKDIFGVEGVLPFGGEATAANTFISPKYFKEFVLPYSKMVQEKVLAMGFKTTYIHICGEQNGNLPYWAEIPFGDPGIISIGQEVELEKAAQYFPNDIILGNLDPAVVMFSTPEQVYEASRQMVEKGKKLSGGYIFSVGCELPPMASPENVMAMTEAVNDHGWY